MKRRYTTRHIVHLSQADHERLTTAAEELGTSVSEASRLALRVGLPRLLDVIVAPPRPAQQDGAQR